MAEGEVYRALGEQALGWVLAQVRSEPDGPWLPTNIATDDAPGSTAPDEFRDSIYDGLAGLALLLAEVRLSRQWEETETDLAQHIVDRLAQRAPLEQDATLYSGLAGHATALTLLAPGREVAALSCLVDRATPDGWLSTEGQWAGVPVYDVVMGTAGIVLAGVWQGTSTALEVARLGAEALLGVADQVAGGLDWPMSPTTARRMPNYSHGTAGVVAALAMAGRAFGQERYLEAARLGAEHLVRIGDRSDDGFRLPVIIPWEDKDGDEFTYSWCHGPTGTAYAFAALREAGVGAVGGVAPHEWQRRCLHALATSGIPDRLRPGFWDNDGRCCGTAGAGTVFLDAAQATVGSGSESSTLYAAECIAFAARLGDALVERAVVDESGARWRFVEHRNEQPLLAPGTGWMQGAAGIAAYLLRLARVLGDVQGAAVLDLPDQWWAVPAELRVTRR